MRINRFLTIVTATFTSSLAVAAPPAPSGPHPRLFMSPQQIAAYGANAQKGGTAAAAQVTACQRTIDNPNDYTTRGGADGNTWPGAAVACAFAYRATQQAKYLTQAIKYWQASLDDDQALGDGKGCVDGVSTDWQTWAQNGGGAPPPVLITVTHDTGYPMRWYGPDVALTYDWLSGAPGVSPQLLAQTRTCLTNWSDWYTRYGYHHDEAGANYNAGFIVAKALTAVAVGTDGGADGHLWSEIVDDQFGKLLVGDGLANWNGAGPAGAMVGGDWLEGWQYGPLSVLEYAVAARALAENGAPEPAMDAWVDDLAVRYVHATVPALDGAWVGGDFDSTRVYGGPSANVLDAVLAGRSQDASASWAAFMRQAQKVGAGPYVYNALAELRTVAPADYRAQMPAPPRHYLARGSRAFYVRTGWDAGAFWAVFASPPQLVSDHQHFAASNFVFSRGGDHLIVDPSQYGAEDTLETNALSIDSPSVPGDYAKSQTPWSEAELPWARATESGLYAARSDIAKAFIFNNKPSDVPYAHREWVFLPEGEIVTIDRAHTADAQHVLYVNFHANTKGTLKLAGSVAAGTVGGSQLVIHAVKLSGGTPAITAPGAIGTDGSACPGNYPNGSCTNARFPVDIYALQVPGPQAKAVHVIDGLGASEAPATVAALDDPAVDPAGDNGGVLGAAVWRGGVQSYVVASSAADGMAGATLRYGVPGTASRHVVFDAPEAGDGSSQVTATPKDGRCEITITAGAGGGMPGRPLLFNVDGAGQGCAVKDASSVPPPASDGGVGPGPSDGGVGPGPGGDGGAGTNLMGGCGCQLGARRHVPLLAFAVGMLAFFALRRRRRAKR